MRVQWLNKERTEALVTRGWLRKQIARVKFEHGRYGDPGRGRWVFKSTERYVGYWTNSTLLAEEVYAATENEWIDIPKLPEARLLESSSDSARS